MYDQAADNIRSLVEHVGFVDELADPEAEAMYAPVREGRCMTCGAECGTTTMLIINAKGILGAYCSGSCLQDMSVLGWLQEQHQDVIDRVKFRGGDGDSA